MQIVIADQNVALFSESAQGGVIRLETGSEDDRGFLADEGGQLGLQLHMKVQSAVEEARSATTAAIFLQRVNGCFFDLWVIDEIQVVVGSEHQHPALAHSYFARAAAIAVAEDLEIHVEPSGLQVTRASEITALLEDIVRGAPFFPAADVASRYAHWSSVPFIDSIGLVPPCSHRF